MIALLLTAALAADPVVCLDAADYEARILEPLHALDRCRREVEILTDERATCARSLGVAVQARDEAQEARDRADRRARGANRRAVVAGPSGAAVGALLVVLLVLL